ncbi:HNH endonuclease [Cesiribacter sp. SM1]|uniref:HNH endonuclease n=1 Tax=Cesiribacter sp. SM1 TaxID=2861196 RepID=UPI001CD3323E|nr:HNH endonuclease [Cesiribacter sp. SM1]
MSQQLKLLSHYNKRFSKLKRDHKFGGAPHKPILLLSILHQISSGQIANNKIYITPELISTFKDFWSLLVTTPHTPNFALPFYHMQSEGFWHLIVKPGHHLAITKSHSIRSFSSLQAAIAWAEFDQDLYQLLQEDESRELLRMILLHTYFPAASDKLLMPIKTYLHQLEEEILHEPATAYQARLISLQKQLSKEELEEETFVRDGTFKKVIANIYSHTCAISGLRVEATQNISMIDGCHIKPWSISHDDTATNGIALCPNLHRAFDRGLITLDEDYQLVLSKHFIEPFSSPYNIRQFEGKQVLLPNNTAWHPSQENLEHHRINTFIN